MVQPPPSIRQQPNSGQDGPASKRIYLTHGAAHHYIQHTFTHGERVENGPGFTAVSSPRDACGTHISGSDEVSAYSLSVSRTPPRAQLIAIVA